MFRIWNGERLFSKSESKRYVQDYCREVLGLKLTQSEAVKVYAQDCNDIPVTLSEMKQIIKKELTCVDWAYCYAEYMGFGIVFDYNEF